MVASIDNVAIRWHASGGVWPDELLARLGMPELRGKWPQRIAALGERIGGGLTARCAGSGLWGVWQSSLGRGTAGLPAWACAASLCQPLVPTPQHRTPLPPPRAAAHLGLPPGLPVAQGGADAFIGCIGLGVVSPGDMAMLTGSSHLHIGMAAAPMCGPGMFGSYKDAVLPGVHVVEGGQTSTGSAVNWLRRALLGGGVDYAELNEEAAAVPLGCEGLVCLDHFQVGAAGDGSGVGWGGVVMRRGCRLRARRGAGGAAKRAGAAACSAALAHGPPPYLQGNRTPHTDPLSRGALVGLTLKHTRGHVFRGLIEAVAFGTEAVLEAMRGAGYT
jgi:ribulose kinase